MNNIHVHDSQLITISSRPLVIHAAPNNGSEQETAKKCESEKLLENKSNLEDILKELKVSGRYHLRFICLLMFLLITTDGLSMNYIFTAENVTYRCKYSKCKDTEISKLEKKSNLDFKCHKYELLYSNGTCTEDSFDVSSITKCSEWVYEKPNSFIADFNLECKDWKRTLVGTMHSSGLMVGLLVLGPMSDKFGRKKIILFSTLFTGTVGILKSRVSSYWMFIVLEMLEPLLGDNYSIVYTMAAEMVTTKSRPIIALVFSVSITVSEILMAYIAYVAPNWRTFLVFIYIPPFLAILYIIPWTDESPRWLLIKGRKAEAAQIIRKAAMINNIVIDESKIRSLKSEEELKTTLWASLKVTCSSKKLFLRLILCCCIWFTAVFNSYALSINSVSMEGNKYINYGLISISGSIAGVILLYTLTKFQRKRPLILTLILTGVFCSSQSFIPKGYRWLSTLLYMFGKINAAIISRTTYLYTVELFPTYTRNTMLAFCSSFGRTGGILAPFTPLLLTYWSGFPSFVVGILSLTTALVVSLMPDTADDVLPDNVKQAENIGCK